MLATVLALALFAAPRQLDTIEWEADLEVARARALELGRPLLAVFRCEP